MFVREKERKNGATAVQIVECVRVGGKVRQKVVRHIGQGFTKREVRDLVEVAKTSIAEIEFQRKMPLLAAAELPAPEPDPPQPLTVNIKRIREEKKVVEGIGDIFGRLYAELGMDHLISGSRKDLQWNEILKFCVMARVFLPSSKRKTVAILERDFDFEIPLEKVYRTMDHVAENESVIKDLIAASTRALFANKVDVIFFDVTTLYFESFEPDSLRDFGFSKDCKFKETQVVLALATTTGGLPLTYELFPGSMYEGSTLVAMVEEMRRRFDVADTYLVADRAMFTKENLAAMDALGMKYVVAAKLKTLRKSEKKEILESFGERGDSEIVREFRRGERRLVVSYTPKRAAKDASERRRLVERLLKKAKSGKIAVKSLIANRGTSRFITVEEESKATINEAKIEEEARWDGLHGLITNVEDRTADELLERYRGLWRIEAAFRVCKHDLRMRPVYHWTERRIRAHVAICFLAYALSKHVEYALATNNIKLSLERLREELSYVHTTILRDTSTRKRYAIPSQLNEIQQQIYDALGLERPTTVRQID